VVVSYILEAQHQDALSAALVELVPDSDAATHEAERLLNQNRLLLL
jgi:hypothetical protein